MKRDDPSENPFESPMANDSSDGKRPEEPIRPVWLGLIVVAAVAIAGCMFFCTCAGFVAFNYMSEYDESMSKQGYLFLVFSALFSVGSGYLAFLYLQKRMRWSAQQRRELSPQDNAMKNADAMDNESVRD